MPLAAHFSREELQVFRTSIATLEQAKTYIEMLYATGMAYHFDDDPRTIIWGTVSPNVVDMMRLDKRRDELYSDQIDWSESGECPIGYCLVVMARTEAAEQEAL